MKKQTDVQLPTRIGTKVIVAMSVAINTLRKQAKTATEKFIVDLLNSVSVGTPEEKTLLLRNLFNIIDRDGGKEMGLAARAIIRWLEDRWTGWFYKNLWAVPHFVKWEYLWYNEIRTTKKSSKKNPGKVLSHEWMDFDMNRIAVFVAAYIRSGQDCGLLAKWLPKYRKTYYSRKRVDKNGAVTRWKAEVRPETRAVVAYQNDFIRAICREMGWSLTQYAKWRSENQRTIEQEISKGDAFENAPETTITEAFGKMASSARFRINRILTNAKRKLRWPRVANVYKNFEKKQDVIAEKMRKAIASGDTEQVKILQKASKVKTGGGMQTFDLLREVMSGNKQMADTTHTNLMARLNDQLDGDLYTIIDWSGSMDSYIPGTSVRFVDVANALAITFATMHKNPAYRNEFMVFSSQARVIGTASEIGEGSKFQVAKVSKIKQQPVIKAEAPFSKNLEMMNAVRRSTPKLVSSTNMGSVFHYFIDLVKSGQYTAEDLPVGLLFITDEENNMGKHPTECMADAAAIGWFPLVVWWGIHNNRMSGIRCENFLPIGGYSETVLNQVLSFLRNGPILPGAELLAINDNPRYQQLVWTE